ncbi:MAG: hypothetical protein Q8O30_13355 [Candidatus Omnitrophota bacterium]|nr:hypothetical protein [Candidatus Omnitrophota bacterium]
MLKAILSDALIHTKNTLGRLSLSEIETIILEENNYTVSSGPFKGMKYIAKASGSALSPKILGTYEKELHDIVHKIIRTHYKIIYNIGSAEGYYAVGLARCMKNIIVFAYDIDVKARKNLARLAKLNNVDDRIIIKRCCNLSELKNCRDKRCLIICDIEGGEKELLDPVTAVSLLTFDILVEIHDGKNSNDIHTLLFERFKKTHHIIFLKYQGRSKKDYNSIASIKTDKDKAQAVNEYRRLGLEWGFFKAIKKNTNCDIHK